jgi:hypothetical protein
VHGNLGWRVFRHPLCVPGGPFVTSGLRTDEVARYSGLAVLPMVRDLQNAGMVPLGTTAGASA